MSTYLKSAAMSLLSKTLQTFLTKYLSDVDVEGVTLPSYDGSGWGVRLSNVQLREGVQLMKKMPGRVAKKRTVRRRRRRRRALKGVATEEIADPKGSTSEKAMRPSRSRSKNETVEEGTESRTQKHSISRDTEGIHDQMIRLNDQNIDSKKENPKQYRRSRTGSAISTEDLEILAASAADYYSSDDDLEYDGNGNAVPSNPARTSSGVFACFYKRNSGKGVGKKIDDHSLHQGQQQTESNGDAQATDSGATASVSTLPTDKLEGVIESNGNAASDLNSTTTNTQPDMGGDDDMYEYYDEDCEEEHELPLRLCLGEHGRIGMVDVRLIGKELHVMVEDAMVTIEAIPILPEDIGTEEDGPHGYPNEIEARDSEDEVNGKGSVSDASNDPAEGENGNSDTAVDGTKKSTKKPKPEPKRDTVGDRVLADNWLARLISAVPHLFLRDICVRLIVRDEPTTSSSEENGGNTTSSSSPTDSNAAAENNTTDKYEKPQSSSKDTMVEVGIDFLSVTSGEDILSHFQKEHTSAEDDLQNTSNENDFMDSSRRSGTSYEDSVSTKPPSLLKIPSNFVDANGEHKNEYLVRHIRTGRGPSGGISVRVFVPNSGLSKIVRKCTASSGDVWARQHWVSATENHLLRCSGLDIQARIHMGTKRVDAGYSWFYGEYVDETEEGSEIDSMVLFGSGMDTVAPGQLPLAPIEPLPPIEPRMSRGNTPAKRSNSENTFEDNLVTAKSDIESLNQQLSSMHPGVDMYYIDANGIQSCKVPSLFHRVSRGMVLKSCKDCNQLPSEVSDLCWEVPSDSNVKSESSLDSSIPMPGLALQISVREPLEINIDRNSIESIGLMKSIFTKPITSKSNSESNSKKENEATNNPPEVVAAQSISEETTQTTTTSTGFFSGLLYGRTEETIPEEEVQEDSFENYMQPENVSVTGIYLAETIIRVHVMQEDKDDRNLSFCYWQIDTHCLTIDRQTLASPEKTFSDLKLDVGRIVWDEYRGTGRRNIVSLGIPHSYGNRQRLNSHTSLSSMVDDHAQNKAPWPSTACALLDIPPPPESLNYKSREGHGIQLRFISAPSSTKSDQDKVSRSLIYLRLGVTTVDSNWEIKNQVNTIIREFMTNIIGEKKAAPAPTDSKNEGDGSVESEKIDEKTEPLRKRFLMAYTIQIDSGNISLPPIVQVKMPMTRFSGERSSLAGFSIESVLGKVELAHGSKEPSIQKKCLVLPQIAGLPESVRMHILLCLKDLSPLEIALGVKKEKNSFRRIKAIDKAMLKTAKKIARRASKASGKKKSGGHVSSFSSHGTFLDSANRREQILTEIMKLDDGELTSLWSVHQRYQKKLAKRLRQDQDE